MHENTYDEGVLLLRQGKAPGNLELISEISVGLDFVADFWKKHYLDEYIAQGGSRIQFVTGRPGSGKTHLAQYFMSVAGTYKLVYMSARQVRVHDFKEVYAEILRQVDISHCIRLCADAVIREMGFDPEQVSQHQTFADYLSGQNSLDAITRREIREQISAMFIRNPLIDNNFALCAALLTGGVLGHPTLAQGERQTLLDWMMGSREVKLAAIKSLGLSPSRVTKYNARHMLRSLTEVVKLAGFRGLIVSIDDMDALIAADPLADIRYTKLQREDAYESIRELIDRIDTLQNIMFLIICGKNLMESDIGITSYSALWMRVQNEIHGERINRFGNILDLDRLDVYNVEAVLEMSGRLVRALGAHAPGITCRQDAEQLVLRSRFASVALPRNVVNAIVPFRACAQI